MKKFLFILVSSVVFSQEYYVPDMSFSDDGFVSLGYHSSVQTSAFSRIEEIGGNYYATIGSRMIKISSSGEMISEYTSPLPLLNIKYTDDYIYLLGYVGATGDYLYNAAIQKLDLDLNPVAAFGNNGIVTLDFGKNEDVSDFVFDSDGNLYCSGTQWGILNWNPKKMILFKVDNTTGNIITTFDAAGYKEYVYHVPGGTGNEYSEDAHIAKYNGNYLVAGRNFNGMSKLVSVYIDGNGAVLDGYGTNGFLVTDVGATFTYDLPEIKDIRIVNNRLYMYYFYQPGGASFVLQGATVHLDTNTTVLMGDYNPNSINIYDDGVYTTMRHYTNNYPFIIKRKTLDGNIDSSFHNAGTYSQAYANNNNNTIAMCKDSNGNIVFIGLAGTSSDQWNLSTITVGRITPGIPLNVDDSERNSVLVYPNPFDNQINIESIMQITRLEIYDAMGRLVFTPKFGCLGTTVTADLSGLSTGMYIIKITSGNNTLVRKVTKK